MRKVATIGVLAGLSFVGTAYAEPVLYTWTGVGINVPGSSKCPTYKMTINVTVEGTASQADGSITATRIAKVP